MARRRLRFLRTCAAFLLCQGFGCSRDSLVGPQREVVPEAPEIGAPGESIPGRYIVVFRPSVADAASKSTQKIAAHQGKLAHSYRTALKGFAAELSEEAVTALRDDPDVAYVEPDQVVHAFTTQSNATWGLDRIDQRALPLGGTYDYTSTGAGVTAYIIDTGILFGHAEFGGRAVTGFDAVGSGGNAADCNGHGTHVAGTVGGTTFGVAKNVRLVAVRVLDCSGAGSLSGVIAGVDWVTANHVSPAVANMSLGGGSSTALDTAVRNSIGSGVTYVLAAGNSSADACGSSPARVAEAITVGAVTSSDARATYSNYGACLDLFAPGSSITSAWHTGPTATNTISGTSMASPHVTGVAALYLQLNPAARPDAVANAIVGSVTSGKVTSPGAGSPNRLLYSLLSGGGNNPPNPPVPPTDPGSPCSGCTAFTGNLAGPGDFDRQPLGTYYYSRVSGSHRAWLHGPAGADFDVYLYKLTGFGGFLVAWGDGPTSTEQVNYSGGPGYYMWIVRSFSGSGSYTFWLQKPPTTS